MHQVRHIILLCVVHSVWLTFVIDGKKSECSMLHPCEVTAHDVGRDLRKESWFYTES